MTLRPRVCLAINHHALILSGLETGLIGNKRRIQHRQAVRDLLEVDDLAALTKANYECNELGIDTISMGSTVACAMELVEKGYLPESEIGELKKMAEPVLAKWGEKIGSEYLATVRQKLGN